MSAHLLAAASGSSASAVPAGTALRPSRHNVPLNHLPCPTCRCVKCTAGWVLHPVSGYCLQARPSLSCMGMLARHAVVQSGCPAAARFAASDGLWRIQRQVTGTYAKRRFQPVASRRCASTSTLCSAALVASASSAASGGQAASGA
jgi:hypothetical protein